MRAIILAAGQGTRLLPFTSDRPKCMVQLLGRPLLHHLLDAMQAAGVEDIVVVAGHLAEQLDAPGCRIVFSPDYADTNMVRSLFAASEFMEEGADLLVSYADTIFEPGVIRAVLGEHAGDLAIGSDDAWRNLWSLRMSDPLRDAESFQLDPDGRIQELGRVPASYADVQGQYMGIFKIRGSRIGDFKRFYDALDRGVTYDGQPFRRMFMTSLLQALIEAGWHAQAVRVQGGWLEIDSIDDLRLYEDLARRGELDSYCRIGRDLSQST